MQVLPQTNISSPAFEAARAMMDGLPPVMWFIRRHMRRHRTAGMSVPQFRAMCVLERNPTANLCTLAELLGASQPTLSRLISGLVTRGYVARKTCSDDRRQCELLLTSKGREKVEQARHANLEALTEQIAHFDPVIQQKIIEVMKTLEDVFSPRSTN
jgi:DNA-binding MarR family transcriptional regulator